MDVCYYGILMYSDITGNILELMPLSVQQMKISLFQFCFASCHYREYSGILTHIGIVPLHHYLGGIWMCHCKGPIIYTIVGNMRV